MPSKPPPTNATKPPSAADERLVRRVMQVATCSRSEAENYITGGWVRVNGVVVELPGHRVSDEVVTLDPQATLLPQPPVTLLLHKPPGFDALADALAGPRPAWKLLAPSNRATSDASGTRLLQQHLVDLVSASPLEPGASGLVVFTKDWRVQRKLVEDAALVEHELMVQVRGTVTPEALRWLNQSQVVNGRAMHAAKVSISSQPEAKPNTQQKAAPTTGLRFALKGHYLGQIDHLCRQVNLQITTMKRIRVGRVALANLPEGQWRYLGVNERF
jgi:23S rRNA pseudouridine2604 synthase